MVLNATNSTFLDHDRLDYQDNEINLQYVICEIFVAVFAIVGNALVIFVFKRERRLRRRTNYYIVSLAVADLLVGLLGIPFAIMSSVGLPTNLHLCLFTVSLLVVLCTISIFCLVAVSVDRYWAILYPMGYSRNVSTKTAKVIIAFCWVTGSFIGFLPLMGWHKTTSLEVECFFLQVMDYNYLVFLYFGTIITPALVLAAFYAHIYRVVLKQLKSIMTMHPEAGVPTNGGRMGGTMLRTLGASRKREVKATQNLAIIVLFFMICWIPLYTINCVLAFCKLCSVESTFMFFCIILSHLNSAGNPLLYAYHLRDFRAALRSIFYKLFGYKEVQVTYSQTLATSCKNDNKTTLPSHIQWRKKKITNLKIPSIAGNSNKTMNTEVWKVEENSSGSENSPKINVKFPSVSQLTPYRIFKLNKIKQVYFDVSKVDDSNEVLTTMKAGVSQNIITALISNASSQCERDFREPTPTFQVLTGSLYFGENMTVSENKPRFQRSLSDGVLICPNSK